MNIYLVGGAVRDKLLGIQPKDRDWVVTGATPKEMLLRGFVKVGAEFPVFLHPITKEEYALARTERKTATGYKGFQTVFDSTVTLEEDLKRRDLTINAIAEAPDGSLIDPFHGKQDLENRILRHVSPAFSEDPVRTLRLARFAAQFSFDVADETRRLLLSMQDEVKSLVPERVLLELSKAMKTRNPSKFFDVLYEVHLLDVIFPFSLSRWGVMLEKTPVSVRLAMVALLSNNALAFAKTLKFSEWDTWLVKMCLVPDYVPEFDAFSWIKTAKPAMSDAVKLRKALGGKDLTAMLKVKRSAEEAVTAKDFPDLSGKALGTAITEARRDYVKERMSARF